MSDAARRCLRAVIAYDGTAFAGSQYQPQRRTVQGELEAAITRLTGETVRVRLAGRTDAGVHADGQVAAFCLPVRLSSLPELRKQLNATLPADLAVRSTSSASSTFDPRRDARWRVYRYRVRTAGDRRPADGTRALTIDDRLDLPAMRASASHLTGTRDFAALGSDPHGRTMRNLAEVRITARGTLVEIRVTADAFLRGMVRRLVAILLEVGRGRLQPSDVPALLEERPRALHGRAAPARGLTLERVIYPRGAARREAGARA